MWRTSTIVLCYRARRLEYTCVIGAIGIPGPSVGDVKCEGLLYSAKGGQIVYLAVGNVLPVRKIQSSID